MGDVNKCAIPASTELLRPLFISHLVSSSVKALESSYGATITWVVPLGVGATLKGFGVTGQVIELDWWRHRTLKIRGVEVSVVCLPTQHFSGRGLLDRDSTLWSSQAVIGPTKRFWFAGESPHRVSSYPCMFFLCLLTVKVDSHHLTVS